MYLGERALQLAHTLLLLSAAKQQLQSGGGCRDACPGIFHSGSEGLCAAVTMVQVSRVHTELVQASCEGDKRGR